MSKISKKAQARAKPLTSQTYIEFCGHRTVNELRGGPSPSGRGRREAPGEGRKSIRILGPSPYPLPEGEGGSETASSRCCRKTASGTFPTNWTVSLMTVFGTPRTPYRLTRSGNSLTSTTSAITCELAIAILWASLATSGQWGQVGVTNTWMWTSLSSLLNTSFVSSERSASAFDTSTKLPIRTENS